MNGKITSGEWKKGGRRKAEGGRRRCRCRAFSHSSFPLPPSAFPLPPRAFTLVELLVTITIIGIVAGISLGALQMARRFAAEEKTKATIAKLDAIVMQRYESYRTRRVPINTAGMQPRAAALFRYRAIMDLMRLEMPERPLDFVIQINNNYVIQRPISGWTSPPALTQKYYQKYVNAPVKFTQNGTAKCLYMWISMSDPAVMEQFSQNEIGYPDNDGWPVFIDGWGKPINFLRWAPGYSSGEGLTPNNIYFPKDPTSINVGASGIQTGDPQKDHNPFDSRRVMPSHFRLIPFIYSAGPDQRYGIVVDNQSTSSYFYNLLPVPQDSFNDFDPYATIPGSFTQFGTTFGLCQIGTPVDEDGAPAFVDNITNHQIEMK